MGENTGAQLAETAQLVDLEEALVVTVHVTQKLAENKRGQMWEEAADRLERPVKRSGVEAMTVEGQMGEGLVLTLVTVE